LASISQSVRLPFIRLNLWEQVVVLSSVAKWTLLASIVGVLAGSASAAFLGSLGLATAFRIAHPWLLFLLPVCGLAVGFAYHKWGRSVESGNNLILEHIHEPAGGGVPLLMAPFILIATVLSHLFGASAGREGTALQMGGSLAAWISRTLQLRPEDTRLMLMAGMSAGFGAVFGVPLAGAIFGMEVQAVGRIRYNGILPCLVGSVVGDLVCRAWGIQHGNYAIAQTGGITVPLILKLAVAGIIFGITALIFSEFTHAVKDVFGRLFRWPPLRPAIGGLVIISMTYAVGNNEYLGLSLPLLSTAAGGGKVVLYAFALKLLFTAVTLGSGFKGGEVTPLFVIGATLGYSLSYLMGGPTALFATAGFIAVFAAAANTPIACFIMGVELFGGAYALPYGIVCIMAYLFSGHRGIYLAQRVESPKSKSLFVNARFTLREVREANSVTRPSRDINERAESENVG
jgi:H+/Cl- antiporter ClcA